MNKSLNAEQSKLFFTGITIFLLGTSLFAISDHLQIFAVILMLVAAALFGASIGKKTTKK